MRKNAPKTLSGQRISKGYPKGTVLVPLYQAQWRTMAPLCLIQGHSLGSFSLSSLLASFATAQHHPKDRPFGNNAQTLLLQCPFLRSPLSRPQHSKWMRFKRISIKNRCFFDPGRSPPRPVPSARPVRPSRPARPSPPARPPARPPPPPRPSRPASIYTNSRSTAHAAAMLIHIYVSTQASNSL